MSLIWANSDPLKPEFTLIYCLICVEVRVSVEGLVQQEFCSSPWTDCGPSEAGWWWVCQKLSHDHFLGVRHFRSATELNLKPRFWTTAIPDLDQSEQLAVVLWEPIMLRGGGLPSLEAARHTTWTKTLKNERVNIWSCKYRNTNGNSILCMSAGERH